MTFKKSLLLTLSWVMLAGIGSTIVVLAGVHLYLSPSLPSVESLRDIRLQTPLRIYSSDGKLIGEIGEKRRNPIEYKEIPQGYIDALLSAEDAQFYSHHGVSIKGLMRASSQLLMSGDIQGGGSTITMQVARNFFLSNKQEFRRKFNEILLALRIERELSKEDILELYVNVIFLGNRSYGIQAAAQVYYGKLLSELSLPQLAMLAGIPKAPSTMNPLANPERAKQRRDWILGRMLELDKIDEHTYQQALAEPLNAKYHGNSLDLNASYVAEIARQKAVSLFGPKAYTDGYRVYTTIDSGLQKNAQEAVIAGLMEYDQRHGFRGPERQLPVPEQVNALLSTQAKQHVLGDAETGATADKEAVSLADNKVVAAWHQSLLQALKEIQTYAGLRPAAIIRVEEKAATALLSDGTPIELEWENGLADAQPYLSVNSRGHKPKSAADVVAPGDVIRTQRSPDGAWQLTQVPDAQAALVSLNPRNGAVMALMGGLDFQQSNFNRATQAYRQPGSNFKPFIYTAALENGFTAASIINDAPIVFDDIQLENAWRPENSGGNFYGPTRLRKALYLSRNLVSIRLLRSIGITTALKDIHRFGFDKDKMPRDLSLALGSHAMTPMEIATGYAVFANGGYQVEPYVIERILNFDGEAVYESLPPTVCHACDEFIPETADGESSNDPFLFRGDAFDVSRRIKALLGILEPQDYPRAARVVDEEVAYIMDSMLQDVIIRGTATKAKSLKRSDLAGKTGTTNNVTDAWFSGYGGDLVTTTWVGFDQASTLGRREYGGTAALPIWMRYMGAALQNRPEANRPRPPGLMTVRINPATGKRASAGVEDAIFEIFRSNSLPPFEDESGATQSPWDEPDDISTEAIF